MSGIECAFFGALGRDAEARTSKTGRQYLRLNVRVGDGDDAQWVNVACFDRVAIGIAERFVAGARTYVEGRLTANDWTGSDGVKRTGLSVLAWHCRLSDIGRHRRTKRRSSRKPKASVAAGLPFYSDDIPF